MASQGPSSFSAYGTPSRPKRTSAACHSGSGFSRSLSKRKYGKMRLQPAPLRGTTCQNLAELISALHTKQKIVVIVGAGISASAGMPTFSKSSSNQHLLQKDMLDASMYNDETSTERFQRMIRAAAQSAAIATPTPFHHFLAQLARDGRLLRLYSQNVDDLDVRLEPLATVKPLPHQAPWPKTIQLHGSLGTAVCASCRSVSKLEPEQFHGPSPPDCSNCKAIDVARKTAGKRSRGIGRLRPRIALYNEEVADSEAIGAVMQADLRKRPDAVVVVGTSLKIPGLKKFTREVCTTVQKRRDGLTVWINPEDCQMKGIWDIVFGGTSDAVAAAAG
ncbi:MAG: hypothetical protein Q9159_000411 [Coniocarpon cinnabarinum]